MPNFTGTYIPIVCSTLQLLPGSFSGSWASFPMNYYAASILNSPQRVFLVSGYDLRDNRCTQFQTATIYVCSFLLRGRTQPMQKLQYCFFQKVLYPFHVIMSVSNANFYQPNICSSQKWDTLYPASLISCLPLAFQIAGTVITQLKSPILNECPPLCRCRNRNSSFKNLRMWLMTSTK